MENTGAIFKFLHTFDVVRCLLPDVLHYIPVDSQYQLYLGKYLYQVYSYLLHIALNLDFAQRQFKTGNICLGTQTMINCCWIMICLPRYLSKFANPPVCPEVPCVAVTHQLCMQVLKSDSIYTVRAVHTILHSISITCRRASICPTRSCFCGVDIMSLHRSTSVHSGRRC